MFIYFQRINDAKRGNDQVGALSSNHWVSNSTDLPVTRQGGQARTPEVAGLPHRPDSLVRLPQRGSALRLI